jgi:hypothetical protein
MHRRGVVLLVGFLAAIVVAGGAGVTAPRLDAGPSPRMTNATSSVARATIVQARARAE